MKRLLLLTLCCLLQTLPAWPLSQTLEHVARLQIQGFQKPEELMMLARLQARRSLLEQGATFLSNLPGAKGVGKAELLPLAAMMFQAELFDVSPDRRQIAIKAKALADTSLLPENLSDYRQDRDYTLQGVQRSLDRAHELETAVQDYMTRLTRIASASEADVLRKEVGEPLNRRYQASDLFEKGMGSLSRDRLQEANRYFTQALALDPDYGLAQTMRGMTALRANEYDAALGDFNKALAQRPKDELLLLLRATAYVDQGILPLKAVEDLNLLIKQNPNLARAYYLRAESYVQLRRCQDAYRDFARACELGLREACAADCRQRATRRRLR